MTWEDTMLAEARETNKWLRLLALPALRERLAAALTKAELRRAYQASDGRSIREVAADAKVSFRLVQSHWQEWAPAGLLEPTGVQGRFRRIVDLREVGMEE